MTNYICVAEPTLCVSNPTPPPSDIPDVNLGTFTDDGSCQLDIIGCMDDLAVNYDPLANIDSGECLYEGCDDMSAYNYAPLDPAGTVWDAYNYNLCEFAGCAYPFHPSDSNLASANNGAANGCAPASPTVIPNGIEPTGELDSADMSCCDFPGCTDPTMANYNQYATSDDGSCIPFCKRVKAIQCKPDTEGDEYERTIGCMWIDNWEAETPNATLEVPQGGFQLQVDPTEIVEEAVFKITGIEDDSGQASNFPSGNCGGSDDILQIKKKNRLREIAQELGYLNKYEKVSFIYTEQGGYFYGLDVYVSKDQPQRSDKLKYDEANEWLKGVLEGADDEEVEMLRTFGIEPSGPLKYSPEEEIIPRRYNSGMEDLDLIVDRLEELGIEASHGDYMDVS